MKHLVLITTASALLNTIGLCLAQKATEPAAANAGSAALDTPAASGTRPGRKPAMAMPSQVSSPPFAGTYYTTGSRGDSIPPVMIRFSEPDAKANAALEEDLFVMARVISRTLDRAQADGVDYKLNVPMLLTGSGRSVRPLYIEGLGPLFMIKVNFPLLPPPKPSEKTTKAPPEDNEWSTAHREVFGQTEVVLPDEPPSRSSVYKEEKVDLLKKELVGALKNASNIRGLASNEFINIAVFGHASSHGKASYGVKSGGYASDTIAAELGVDKGSVLTLRARKGDIDAFAAGKLDADAFGTKVLMTSYFGSGNGITSINSWIQESAGRLPAR
jgi:hypothetical protein